MTKKSSHFSMLRDFHLADLLSLTNGFCGAGAIFALMKYLILREMKLLWVAFSLFPIALFCDFADGRVARWRNHVSLLGQELDSLADLISFGVAPAALAFSLGLQGGWDIVILIYFVGCGTSRLARYNVTASSLTGEGGKVRYYEGTPIPTSLILVAILAFAASSNCIDERLPFGAYIIGPWVFHPITLLYFLSGTAMISKILHVPKL
ncbi:CDP-alcohol phosphatidyltransferase family protein [Pajaroellobacter abortibovis]|uniref:CDP-diacylglycerol--serine O-phosphatidyltransferase n=1 Tax=Pajaroellobacter abortibovis TaxID=1882918 RepID=A0A1L6MUV5_9BACT|nr:CDP-alcohol phosphatidyltransferase family protein [Pajaroellobacter abortibovis]APR99300.1 CDP-diacylglycerol--serine O-phosphatidyltransferase [Pajaroellobacter abortibovis]